MSTVPLALGRSFGRGQRPSSIRAGPLRAKTGARGPGVPPGCQRPAERWGSVSPVPCQGRAAGGCLVPAARPTLASCFWEKSPCNNRTFVTEQIRLVYLYQTESPPPVGAGGGHKSSTKPLHQVGSTCKIYRLYGRSGTPQYILLSTGLRFTGTSQVFQTSPVRSGRRWILRQARFVSSASFRSK